MLHLESRPASRMAPRHRPGPASRLQGLAIVLGAVLAATLAGGSMAAGSEEQALLQRLKKLYPSSGFTAVNKSPLPGLFEVTMGSHVAYVGKDGRYFMLGRLFDLQNQVDLTTARQAGTVKTALNEEQGPKVRSGQRIDPTELPLRNAIVQVRRTADDELVGSGQTDEEGAFTVAYDEVDGQVYALALAAVDDGRYAITVRDCPLEDCGGAGYVHAVYSEDFTPSVGGDIGGWVASREGSAGAFNIFDVNVYVVAADDAYQVNCEYSSALFDPATVERWKEQWRDMIEAALSKELQA